MIRFLLLHLINFFSLGCRVIVMMGFFTVFNSMIVAATFAIIVVSKNLLITL